jgi:hypothetical protein
MVEKVYICQSDHTGIMFIGTSKKKLYVFLCSTVNYKPTRANNYITFSEILKWNNPMNVDVKSGTIRIERMYINQSLLKNSELFSE